MNLQTKALYNLLRLNYVSDPSLPCEKWQVEDLRSVSMELLFKRLAKIGIELSSERMHRFADECDSPEELTELLLPDQEDLKQHDEAYLMIFELWRRLFPERQTLSIFCDELDYQISFFEAGELESDEPIQDALANLDEILSENADGGIKPAKIFEKISSYCAHDLMGFIIDYISNLIDAQNQLYASELIEDFAPYAPGLIWFDFLRARVTALTDPVEANRAVNELLKCDEKLSVDLLLEILRFQAGYGEKAVFLGAMKKILPRLETEEDFRELLTLSQEYFRRRDREDLELAIQQLLIQRQNTSGDIHLSDPAIKTFEKLILFNLGSS